jgi:DNA-binding phage protein
MKSVRQVLREIIRKRGSIRKAAGEIGFDHGNLIRIMREERDPRIKTVEKIADRLGYCLTVKRKGVKKVTLRLPRKRAKY